MIHTTSHVFAKDNMAHDAYLFAQQEPFVRVYTWQMPSITYAHRQTLPEALQAIDNSDRLTGGGIVFHCPGDIVFAMAMPLDGSFKTRLHRIQKALEHVLNPYQVLSPQEEGGALVNREYCATYHSPYELSAGSSKVVGLAAKKNKQHIWIQGIVHVMPSMTHFECLGDLYAPYFTQGLSHLGKRRSPLTLELIEALERLIDPLSGI